MPRVKEERWAGRPSFGPPRGSPLKSRKPRVKEERWTGRHS